MSYNITVEGGSTIRLPVAGKYCDRDIIITAEGGAKDLNAVLTEQEALITTLQETLKGKAAGGGDTELEDALIMRKYKGDYSNSRVTSIASYMFYDCTGLTSVALPNVTTIAANAFGRCTGLKTLDFPKCKTLAGGVFTSCNGVTSANFPVLTTIGSDFNSCIAMKTFNAPMLKTIGNQAFYFCQAIVKLDLPSLTSIGTHGFNNCSKMTALILRNETVCTLANTNGLLNTPVAKGTGYVYVPAALIDSYKSATNWSTYAAQIRAIEDYPEVCEVSV